jgi:hypothetical protein
MLWHWYCQSQPIWLSAFSTITITITRTNPCIIITITTEMNAYAYGQYSHGVGCSFGWKVWVAHQWSPRSNCVPFRLNKWLPLSILCPWGIPWSCDAGCVKDTVQTTIFTDIIMLANICHLPLGAHYTVHTAHSPPDTTHYPPPASCLLWLGLDNAPSLWMEYAGG